MTVDGIKVIIMTMGGGLFLLASGFKRLRRKRLVEDVPTSKSRSAAQGLSEFQGYAWPSQSSVKCSAQNDCVYYNMSLQKLVKKGKNSSWVTVYSHSHASDFFLIDNTGAVHVDTSGGNLQIQKRVTAWKNLSEVFKFSIFEKHPQTHDVPGFPPTENFLGMFSAKFQVVESYILLGSPVLAMGDFSSIALQANGPSPQTPHNAGLAAFYDKVQNDVRLKVGTTSVFFDLNKDGRVSSEELRRGIHYMARSVMTAALKEKQNSAPPHVPLHGRVGRSANHELLIVDSHQQQYLNESNSLWAYFMMLGGFCLIGVSVYFTLIGLNI